VTFDPLIAIRYCWILLGLFWLAGMLFTKPVQRAQSNGARLVHVVLALAGGVLMSGYLFRGTWMDARFLPDARAVQIAGFIVTVAGCLLAAWARITLGGNWSGRATVKAGHELIVKGPYALARHPIYTGLLLALAGTVIAIGYVRGVAGSLVIVIALSVKISQEERLMMQTFPDAYPTYRRRVKALIPGIL
jgi:protein-S-isoprenylcysteine O-methyltransferase Ste14